MSNSEQLSGALRRDWVSCFFLLRIVFLSLYLGDFLSSKKLTQFAKGHLKWIRERLPVGSFLKLAVWTLIFRITTQLHRFFVEAVSGYSLLPFWPHHLKFEWSLAY
jgi:hypothetical protein